MFLKLSSIIFGKLLPNIAIYCLVGTKLNKNLTLQTYHKSTYTGLLLNFKSFRSFSCKVSLIKCLVDRPFKIGNNWKSFHSDLENIKSNLIKNAYPSFLIDKVIKKYLDYKYSSNQKQS